MPPPASLPWPLVPSPNLQSRQLSVLATSSFLQVPSSPLIFQRWEPLPNVF